MERHRQRRDAAQTEIDTEAPLSVSGDTERKRVSGDPGWTPFSGPKCCFTESAFFVAQPQWPVLISTCVHGNRACHGFSQDYEAIVVTTHNCGVCILPF